MKFQSLPGFRDIYPAEMAVRQHIMTGWRKVAHRYGFEEYDGPPLESLELYVAKSGEEIVGQLYNFTDKGGRDVAMRPEMTPTLARMVVAKGSSLRRPIKWFAVPQLFRYERQQKGRLREHWQFNMDILGEADVSADAELLAAAIDSLRVFGLGPADFIARVSDRRLITAILELLGLPAEHVAKAIAVIDKIERTPVEVSRGKLGDLGMSSERIALLELLLEGHDVGALEALLQGLENPANPATEAYRQALANVQEYINRLSIMGLGDFVRLDLRIVRGLAYYTGIVFELFDAKGELRAICGGGRYDHLIETLGGDPMPALGFGMGDVVLAELLKQRGLLQPAVQRLDFYVIPLAEQTLTGTDQQNAALDYVHRLRDLGCSVDWTLQVQPFKKMGKLLKSASDRGARYALLLGEDELTAGTVSLRDLDSGVDSRLTKHELLELATAQACQRPAEAATSPVQ